MIVFVSMGEQMIAVTITTQCVHFAQRARRKHQVPCLLGHKQQLEKQPQGKQRQGKQRQGEQLQEKQLQDIRVKLQPQQRNRTRLLTEKRC